MRFDGLFREISDRKSFTFDAASKAGILCYGWLITRNGAVVARGHGACTRSQNINSNVAEYLALIEGLDALADLGVEDEPVLVSGDAKTIIDQMRGISMVNSPAMKPLFKRARKLSRQFINLTWVWTPRKQNREADLLTRHAMRQVRSDPKNLEEGLRAVDPRHNRGRISNRLHSLVDLRVFLPGKVAT
jgi:ribonuclease HI